MSDQLWARIEPLLPVVARRADHRGRPRLDDRTVLCGILFVLYTGIQWESLAQELGFGSGMTAWRRLRDWNQAGVWQRLHETLLAELHAAGALDWSRSVIDGTHVRAMKGGPQPDRALVDRARTGSKHHLITEAHGIPLPVSLTGGNCNDVTQLMPLIQAIPPVRGRRGRPRQRPDTLCADRGYDHDTYRKQVREVGITMRAMSCGSSGRPRPRVVRGSSGTHRRFDPVRPRRVRVPGV